MQANLVVIHKGVIAFTNYVPKANGIPMRIGLTTFVQDKSADEFFFNIPLSPAGLMQIRLADDITKMYSPNSKVISGPLSVSIGADSVFEYYMSPKGLDRDTFYGNIIPGSNKLSSYSRSTMADLESAGLIASMIYDDAASIFKAAHKAFSNTYPPFWIGNVSDISQALVGLAYIGQDTEKLKGICKKLGSSDDETIAELFKLTHHP